MLIQLPQQTKLWEMIQAFIYLLWYKYSATTHLSFYPNSFTHSHTWVPKKQITVLPLTSL